MQPLKSIAPCSHLNKQTISSTNEKEQKISWWIVPFHNFFYLFVVRWMWSKVPELLVCELATDDDNLCYFKWLCSSSKNDLNDFIFLKFIVVQHILLVLKHDYSTWYT